ncbi:unnamed protein product, partial [Medioppia subpectinata]
EIKGKLIASELLAPVIHTINKILCKTEESELSLDMESMSAAHNSHDSYGYQFETIPTQYSHNPNYPYLDVYPNIYHPYDPITGEYIKPLQPLHPSKRFKNRSQTVVTASGAHYNDTDSETLLCCDWCALNIPVNCLTVSLITNIVLIVLFTIIKYYFIDPKATSKNTSALIEEIILILLFSGVVILIAIFIRYRAKNECNEHRISDRSCDESKGLDVRSQWFVNCNDKDVLTLISKWFRFKHGIIASAEVTEMVRRMESLPKKLTLREYLDLKFDHLLIGPWLLLVEYSVGAVLSDQVLHQELYKRFVQNWADYCILSRDLKNDMKECIDRIISSGIDLPDSYLNAMKDFIYGFTKSVK